MMILASLADHREPFVAPFTMPKVRNAANSGRHRSSRRPGLAVADHPCVDPLTVFRADRGPGQIRHALRRTGHRSGGPWIMVHGAGRYRADVPGNVVSQVDAAGISCLRIGLRMQHIGEGYCIIISLLAGISHRFLGCGIGFNRLCGRAFKWQQSDGRGTVRSVIVLV